jgi:hypothetical protein
LTDVRSSRTVDAVLALEDNPPDVLFASIPGTDIALWPLLRWPLLDALSSEEMSATAPAAIVDRRGLAIRALASIAPVGRASRRIRRPAEFLFVTSGGSTSAAGVDGYRNRLIQDHAEAIDDALILQDSPILPWAPRREQPTFSRTATFDDAHVRAQFRARFRRPAEEDLERSRLIAHEIIDRLGAPLSVAGRHRAIRKLLLRQGRLASTLRDFERVLDRTQPRAIFMQTAAYGDRSALIASAHKRGISVAEHQHGWIGPSHGAYNLGRAMSEGPLRAALPDALLTFGDFWSGSVRVPFDLVPVGKPQLDDERVDVSPLIHREPVVLVISAVYDPSATETFTLQLRDALPDGWRVRFRPHPVERPTVVERYPALAAAGVEFDLDTDVYRSLRSTRAVVGYASTVLWEALAMGCHVVVRDSSFTEYKIDRTVFPTVVGDDDELDAVITRLADASAPTLDSAVLDSVWAPDSRTLFRNFAAGFGR